MKKGAHKKRIMAGLMGLAMMLTAVTGCGVADGGGEIIPVKKKESVQAEQVSIKLWIPEEEIPLAEQLVKNFDAVHEEYQINYEFEPKGIDEASQVLEGEYDTAADIFYLPSGGVESFASRGLLLPIQEGFDKLAVDLPDSAVGAVKVDGTPYAVPFSPNSFFMYYNKEFYSEDEVQSLETMMAKDFGSGKYNFSSQISNSWYLEMFFLGNGCTLFGKDGRDGSECSFNNKNGVAAGNYVVDLVSSSKYIEDAENAGMDLFKSGKVGAITSGAWSAPELKESLGDQLGAAALPAAAMSGEAPRLSNFVDFKTVAAKADTAHPEAVSQLAVYLANKDSSKRRFLQLGEIPVLQNLADNEQIANDIAASALNEQVNYATNQPSISGMDNYWGNMADFGKAILDGSVNKGNMKEKLNQLAVAFTGGGAQQ